MNAYFHGNKLNIPLVSSWSNDYFLMTCTFSLCTGNTLNLQVLTINHLFITCSHLFIYVAISLYRQCQ